MNRLPTELWALIREYTNQERIIDLISEDLVNTLNNFDFIVNDNMRLEEEVRQAALHNEQLNRTNLMIMRSNRRLRLRNDQLVRRINELESKQKRRRVGELLNRTLNLEDVSSDSDATVIEISDTDEVDV